MSDIQPRATKRAHERRVTKHKFNWAMCTRWPPPTSWGENTIYFFSPPSPFFDSVDWCSRSGVTCKSALRYRAKQPAATMNAEAGSGKEALAQRQEEHSTQITWRGKKRRGWKKERKKPWFTKSSATCQTLVYWLFLAFNTVQGRCDIHLLGS